MSKLIGWSIVSLVTCSTCTCCILLARGNVAAGATVPVRLNTDNAAHNLSIVLTPTSLVIELLLYVHIALSVASSVVLAVGIWRVLPSVRTALATARTISTNDKHLPLDDAASTDSAKEDKPDATDKTETDAKKRFKRVHEFWNEKTYSWQEVEKPDATKSEDDNLIFKATHRTYQFDDRDPFVVVQLLSPPLIRLLRKMDDVKDSEDLWDEDPEINVKTLFLFHPELRAQVAKTQKAVQDLKAQPDKTDTDETKDLHNEFTTVKDLEELIDHLECLLDYVDEEFKSTKQKLDHFLAEHKISFHLLWALFKPGSIAVSTHATTDDKIGLKVTRAYMTKKDDIDVFIVQGTQIEHNGQKVYRNKINRSIPFFTGVRKFSQLSISPMQPKVREELTARGRLYLEYMGGPRYVHYTGPLVQRVGKDLVKTKADGRVMADMASFRKMNPSGDMWGGDDMDDDVTDSLDGLSDIVTRHVKAEGDTGPFTNDTSSSTALISDDELCLTAPTIYGFSFVLKDWGELCYSHFSPVQFDEHAYDHLELDPEYKQLIKALVQAACTESEKIMGDVIATKGNGFVACLHGAAGVGKTLTAESIAELLKRPLYSISAGELGTEPRVLERNLRETLEIAKTWDAVLLLDEADVVLEARSQHEINRNGLVSVFLRLLEYHRGILILTTNRIKTFDKAFLSRFSIGIRYPDLNQKTRQAIWIKFLRMAGVSVGKDVNGQVNGTGTATTLTSHITNKELAQFTSKPINGREIKQVVRTSQAIALAEGVPLGAQHVKSVLMMQDRFMKDFNRFDEEDMYRANDAEIENATLYQ